ncbi:MAG: hypothetical protein EBE86_024470 [Hormoscilla sp. GUM202]|nr:hypothetical protein [Hormoscilla sp. GUM202]
MKKMVRDILNQVAPVAPAEPIAPVEPVKPIQLVKPYHRSAQQPQDFKG